MANNEQPTNNNGKTNVTPMSTETLIEIIHERTANLEQASNKSTITKTLDKSLAKLSRAERLNNAATITINRKNNTISHANAMELVEKEWIEKLEQTPPTFWSDKENTYCQFLSQDIKEVFLEHVRKMTTKSTLKEHIVNVNEKQGHYTKRPVKLEINGVRGNIKLNTVEDIIKKNINKNGTITEFKEGKLNEQTRNKTISFKANASAMKDIIEKLKWTVPYTNLQTDTRSKLYIRISCKPWMCKDCFIIGQHQCSGKKCAKCGYKDHTTKDCKSTTKFCPACKQKGHKARDAHCPTYLKNLAKNLIKMDMPEGILEHKKYRTEIIDYLQIK